MLVLQCSICCCHVSVCLSQAGIVSKQLDESLVLAWRLPSSYPRLRFKEIWVSQNIRVLPSGTSSQTLDLDKKLSYRRMTARCVLSVVILTVATQQCRNYLYLYDKFRPNWWYEVGGLVGGNVSWTMCTQSWRDWVGSHCLRCHKQNDDGRIVYITCILTTCCGEIF